MHGVLALVAVAGCTAATPAVTPTEQARQAKVDQAQLFKDQPRLTEPLGLHDAMARALKYNLDLRLKRLEEVVAGKQEEVARLEMLPRLTVAAGYSARSADNASVSQSLLTGMVSSDPTFSREAATGTADFTLSWNLLDFGVSYYQARQEGNRQWIQTEQRRKAAHNLIKDVRFAFWRAAAAQWLEQEIAVIQKSANQAIELARSVEKEKLRSPVQSLQFQLGLLEITRQLEKSRAELAAAKEELAALIQLEPGTPYRLLDDSAAWSAPPWDLATSVDELERWALMQRPELRIEQYQARIEADETRKAIARLFPGLEFDVSRHYDSSALLVYQQWAQAGARLSWNLLRTLTGGAQMDLSANREKVIQMRRLVMHMAIIGQVRIAFHEYRAAHDGLRRIMEENETRQRLQTHTANRGAMGLDSQLVFVHTAASAALGRVQQYEAYARYQSALGRLYASLGWDLLGAQGVAQELPYLTRQLRENDREWQQQLVIGRNVLSDLDGEKSQTVMPPAKEAVMPVWIPPPGAKASPATEPVAQRAKIERTDAPVVQNVRPTSKTRYAVQVASTMDQAGVEQLTARLRQLGYPWQVRETPGADGRMVKQVWLGIYPTNAEAVAAKKRFQQQENQTGFIKVIEN